MYRMNNAGFPCPHIVLHNYMLYILSSYIKSNCLYSSLRKFGCSWYNWTNRYLSFSVHYYKCIDVASKQPLKLLTTCKI